LKLNQRQIEGEEYSFSEKNIPINFFQIDCLSLEGKDVEKSCITY